ncbi:MAG TPA: S9 family peptidase, partial [Thermoanaerobaculia bacterium]|nr:S9 family peptidase [Thermoanaerobaculia bacterium]
MTSGVLAGPPTTRVEPVKEVLGGQEVVDSYRWLEDQEAPATRQWIEAQNHYTDSLLSGLPEREGLAKRFTELLKVDHYNLPVPSRD